MDCAYVGFDSEASCNNATKKPLVIGDTLVHWVPTNAKECHFCYQDALRIYPMIGTQKIIEQRKTWEAKLVDLPQNCTAHYLSTTLDQISA
ncbi:hypothetical protein G9A89_002435 [Geosiphon pyriformis]|nr:hypothetical protein G9A89_002435 [Geosiphon pyriformis]